MASLQMKGLLSNLGLLLLWENQLFCFGDDFRKCADSNTFPCNLMLYAGLPKEGWERYLYDSIDSIADPQKALSIWIANKVKSSAVNRR